MINILLFISCLVISYFIVSHVYIDKQVSKFKRRDTIQNFAKENYFKKLFSNFNFIKTKENFLFLQGNPLNLNAISYYLIKITLTLLFCLAGLINYNSYIVAFILAFLGFSFLDIYITIHKKSRNEEICTDLLSVTNSITMQLASYVPLKDSLKNQYENCKNKDFKKAIMIFSTKYELSEFNIDSALNELNSRFDILEVDMFCNTIRQYNKVRKYYRTSRKSIFNFKR